MATTRQYGTIWKVDKVLTWKYLCHLNVILSDVWQILRPKILSLDTTAEMKNGIAFCPFITVGWRCAIQQKHSHKNQKTAVAAQNVTRVSLRYVLSRKVCFCNTIFLLWGTKWHQLGVLVSIWNWHQDCQVTRGDWKLFDSPTLEMFQYWK